MLSLARHNGCRLEVLLMMISFKDWLSTAVVRSKAYTYDIQDKYDGKGTPGYRKFISFCAHLCIAGRARVPPNTEFPNHS